MMGAEHFCLLDRVRGSAGAGRSVARLAGEHLELCAWEVAAGEPRETPLAEYAECFVVPLAGAVALVGAGGDGDAQVLAAGGFVYVPQTQGMAVRGAGCRYIVVGWPGAAGRAGDGAVAVYRFAQALVPEAPGWRFFSVDGAYLTVGCSYREAPPPAREQPHSHEGEQINLPLEGRFAFTVGGHTEVIAPGWAALTPRGITHTGLHVEFPYFQLIFATPPRGRDYAEFLRSIYREAND
jgi:hypothetical protein